MWTFAYGEVRSTARGQLLSVAIFRETLAY